MRTTGLSGLTSQQAFGDNSQHGALEPRSDNTRLSADIDESSAARARQELFNNGTIPEPLIPVIDTDGRVAMNKMPGTYEVCIRAWQVDKSGRPTHEEKNILVEHAKLQAFARIRHSDHDFDAMTVLWDLDQKVAEDRLNLTAARMREEIRPNAIGFIRAQQPSINSNPALKIPKH